jgi:hypothetical protein
MKVGLVEAIGSGRPVLAAAKLLAACVVITTACTAMAATEPSKPRILSCKGADGKPIITDPSDPRCYKPPPNESERAAAEEARRKQVELYNACKAEQRSLQSLLSRYPDKEKHDSARRTALAQVELSMAASQKRMAQLLVDRKRLLDEAEFYPNGNLPAKLRRDIDGNSALIAAQAQAIDTQKDEAAQKNAFYDEELIKLRKLWAPRQVEARACVAPQD